MSIIRRLGVQIMYEELSCRHHKTRAINLDEPAKLEQDLCIMDNFNVTVNHPSFSVNFQIHALKRCTARDFGTAVCRMLIATIGEHLALQCIRLGTAGKQVFSAIILQEPLLVN